MASMNYGSTVVYFDGKNGNLYLRLRTMSHTIHATKFEQPIMCFYDGKVSLSDGASVTIILCWHVLIALAYDNLQ